jgi:CDP-glucose 4,6-dehydratase
MDLKGAFNQIFQGMTVLVTGHTGFKGSWLSIWLRELGAKVIGYSADIPTNPSNFELTNLSNKITHIQGNICQSELLKEVIFDHKPTAIFHLAAQAIVLDSYTHPRETFESNVNGTLNLLEAIRFAPFVKAAVIVTTDKCYENRDWVWGYREQDALGGKDPYSASKAMAEILVSSYRQSFFNQETSPAIATGRAGNVIGGGDFSPHRMIPDTLKALMNHEPVKVRNPFSVRPWLNVLDPLSGYLWLCHGLLTQGQKYAEAWNFGPMEQRGVSVKSIVSKAIELWGSGCWVEGTNGIQKPEMGMLRLNWDKAANELAWQPTYYWTEALLQTVEWFKAYELNQRSPSLVDMYNICRDQISDYHFRARQRGLAWALADQKIFQVKKDEIPAYAS